MINNEFDIFIRQLSNKSKVKVDNENTWFKPGSGKL